jgi:hypothetical protein
MKFDAALGVGFDLGVEAAVVGHLVVSNAIIYLAKSENEQDKGILLLAPWLLDAMLDEFPVNVGSMALFGGSATVTGRLSQSGLGLMPAAFCEVSRIEFEGRELFPPNTAANTAPVAATRLP